MSLSSPFIRRPVATTLLTCALALAGAIAYFFLPVSPLPQVDFPTIQVSAGLPGASAETMASSVATPLERQFGRIAGVTEMTSNSSLGNTSITLQFDLSRDINAAARDVQAAISAARGQLPANLPSNPRYRKSNPADAPIMILALTSNVYGKARMYDAASSILQQAISQVEGVGQVIIGGGALPAVRVDVNPLAVNNLGLSLEDVRTALAAANANRPKGALADDRRSWTLATTDQLDKASQYKPLIITYRNGAPVRLGDVASVTDSTEDIRTLGLADTHPAVLLILFRQPGANIIDTVDRIRAVMPTLAAEIPPAIKLSVVMDRTTTIRASVHDVQLTLLLSVALVIMVVFIFLRNLRATLIPSVAVPISLIGTFGVMYLCGYSIDNLSLMALTISTGFVVDDAIVVIENITRHMEAGMAPMPAAFQGAREIGFTVLSMSVSLIAVFIPILLMGGIVGRLFREFAVVLSTAIGVSLVVSLTTTPMMCAHLLRHKPPDQQSRLYKFSERCFNRLVRLYEITLAAVLRHPFATLLVLLATIGTNVYLYVAVPKGFFPQQDTGRLAGSIQADQDISFQALSKKVEQFASIVGTDPAVTNLVAFAGSGNSGRMFVTLVDQDKRKGLTPDMIIARLRAKTAKVPGATLFLQATQDIRVGGHSSSAQYQFTLQGDNIPELNDWAPKILLKLRALPGLADVNIDQQNKGLEAGLTIDRDTAARLGITPAAIDSTLYDAFGQRQVSTIYTPLNQYHVVMEASPEFWQSPDGLKHIYVRANPPNSTNASPNALVGTASGSSAAASTAANTVSAANTGAGTSAPLSSTPKPGALVPLSAFARYAPSTTPLSINHQGLFPAITISFNLDPGFSLGTAVGEIDNAMTDMRVPNTIHGTFTGTAQAFQDSLATTPILIAAALAAVYIVLGILYESLVHPITILSTLPSAGVGALLALLIFKTELNVIALIGIILLIGIVKKNAIMMIDFALDAERSRNLPPKQAIFEACLLRFRPILMTTMAALLGGLPLALGAGTGSELRRPLGIAIVGGLLFSQLLTLYTTPVVYLYLDRMRNFFLRRQARPRVTAEFA